MSQISRAAGRHLARKRNPYRKGNAIRGRGKKTEHSPEPKPQITIPEESNCKIFFKSGNSTMLFAKMNRLAATNLTLYIERFCKKHNSNLEGTFIFTRCR